MKQEFPVAFRRLMKKQGLTYKNLGRELYVSQGTVHKYVHGGLEFPADLLRRAGAEVFRLTEAETDNLVALYHEFWSQTAQEKPPHEETAREEQTVSEETTSTERQSTQVRTSEPLIWFRRPLIDIGEY